MFVFCHTRFLHMLRGIVRKPFYCQFYKRKELTSPRTRRAGLTNTSVTTVQCIFSNDKATIPNLQPNANATEVICRHGFLILPFAVYGQYNETFWKIESADSVRQSYCTTQPSDSSLEQWPTVCWHSFQATLSCEIVASKKICSLSNISTNPTHIWQVWRALKKTNVGMRSLVEEVCRG